MKKPQKIQAQINNWFEGQVKAFGVTSLSNVPIWLMWSTITNLTFIIIAIAIARPFSGLYMIRAGNPAVFDIPFIGPFMGKLGFRESFILIVFGFTLLFTFFIITYWIARLSKYFVLFAQWPLIYKISFQKALAVFFFFCMMFMLYVSLDPGRVIRVFVAMSKLNVYKVPGAEYIPILKTFCVVPKPGSLLYQGGYEDLGIYYTQNQVLKLLYLLMILTFIFAAFYHYIKFFLIGTIREIKSFTNAWEGTIDSVVNVTVHMFKRPRLTIDHPWQLVKIPNNRYGQLKITPTNICASCRECETACPDRLINITIAELPDKTKQTCGYTLDVRGCTMCGLCLDTCPHDLISIHRLAIGPVENPNSLVLDLPIYSDLEVSNGTD